MDAVEIRAESVRFTCEGVIYGGYAASTRILLAKEFSGDLHLHFDHPNWWCGGQPDLYVRGKEDPSKDLIYLGTVNSKVLRQMAK